jgi:hypothetical protein
MTKDLIHMKRPPEAMGDMNDKPEEYPYGLRLSLTEADMEKIGLDMPKVGEMVHIMAMTKVTSVHAHDSAQGGASQGVELQITHMKAEIEDTEDAKPADDRTPAQRIYGKK